MRNLSRVWLATSCLAAGPVLAQETPGGGEIVLDEVVVTASRDAKKISSIAQSVIVIEREEIEQEIARSDNAADLISRVVPGYVPDTQTITSASETFRGRNVLVMVDGVPRNTPLRDQSRILSLIDLNNVERIEVVNGASSLYGAGATGGTINFITKRGETDEPTVRVRTGFNAFTADVGDSIAPEANVNVSGRSGNWDYFLSATGEKRRLVFDGAGDEVPSDALLGQGGGDRTDFGNLFGSLGYESGTRRFEATFDWTYAEQEPDFFTDYTTDPVSPDFDEPYFGEPLEEDSKYFTARFTESDFALGGLEIKAFHNDIEKRSPFTLLSPVNSIVYYDPDVPFNRLDPSAPFNQTTLFAERSGLQATVSSPLDALREGATVTWGLDVFHDEVDQRLTNGDGVISPLSQTSIAGFAQVELPITERLRLTGGARYEHFFLEVDDFERPGAAQGTFRPNGTLASATQFFPIDVTGGEFDYGSPTFNLGAVFDVTAELQAFGNFSQGYTLTDIGGFTRRAGVNSQAELCDAYGRLSRVPGCTSAPDYRISYADIAPEPQLVNSYEAGLRGDWGTVRGTAVAFLSTSDDGVNYDIVANRVSQQEERIWGAEATLDVDLSERFTLGGVIGYREGEFDADSDGEIESDEYLPNNRIASTVNGLAYLEGRFASGITARGEVEFFSGRDRIEDEELDGAALLNLSASKAFANESRLDLVVRNVLDTDYINPTATAVRGAPVAGLGRSFGLSYVVEF